MVEENTRAIPESTEVLGEKFETPFFHERELRYPTHQKLKKENYLNNQISLDIFSIFAILYF